MDNNISRRDFLKIMGAGAATVALGTTLTGCHRDLEQISYGPEMGYEELANYFYVEYSNNNEPSYLIIREYKVDDNKYNYYSLVLNNRNNNFYAKKIDTFNLDKNHVPMEAYNEYYQTITCEPIIDIFNEEIGVKPLYKAKEYKQVLRVIEERLNNNKSKPKVKSL